MLSKDNKKLINEDSSNSVEFLIQFIEYFLVNFFDVFNSVPFMVVGLSISYYRKSKLALLFFSSMLLHVLGDIFLHHDDAHGHFFPLSNWRFMSPVSYWDPNHHDDPNQNHDHVSGLSGVTECIPMLTLRSSASTGSST